MVTPEQAHTLPGRRVLEWARGREREREMTALPGDTQETGKPDLRDEVQGENDQGRSLGTGWLLCRDSG